jgi:hypothetical protein
VSKPIVGNVKHNDGKRHCLISSLLLSHLIYSSLFVLQERKEEVVVKEKGGRCRRSGNRRERNKCVGRRDGYLRE